MNIFSRLQDNDLLKYLDEQEYRLVAAIAKEVRYKKNTVFHLATESNLYVIKQGKVAFFMYNHENLPVFFDNVGANETIWESAFFIQKSENIHFHSMEDTQLLVYNKKDLENIYAKEPIIHLKTQAALNDSLCEKHIRLTQKLLGT